MAVAAGVALAAACAPSEPPGPAGAGAGGAPATTAPAKAPEPELPKVSVDQGVDLATRTVRLASFDDRSGAHAGEGTAVAKGKELAVAEANAEGSRLLPDGWKIQLLARDHGGDVAKAKAAYEDVAGEVLAVTSITDMPVVEALAPQFERDGLVAFPTRLVSAFADRPYTPPLGPLHVIEAWRGMDWVVEDAGPARKGSLKAGLVYRVDGYGVDAMSGWRESARKHGVPVVAEQTLKPGLAADALPGEAEVLVASLKIAGATHVLLATLPDETSAVLRAAAAAEYDPVWVGVTPAWSDALFKGEGALSREAASRFRWVTGQTLWGEDVPGMRVFMKAVEAHGRGEVPEDSRVLASYVQTRAQLEAIANGLRAGDLTRKAFLRQLKGLEAFTAGGLVQPMNLSTTPWLTGLESRVMAPKKSGKGWKQIADWASPTYSPDR